MDGSASSQECTPAIDFPAEFSNLNRNELGKDDYRKRNNDQHSAGEHGRYWTHEFLLIRRVRKKKICRFHFPGFRKSKVLFQYQPSGCKCRFGCQNDWCFKHSLFHHKYHPFPDKNSGYEFHRPLLCSDSSRCTQTLLITLFIFVHQFEIAVELNAFTIQEKFTPLLIHINHEWSRLLLCLVPAGNHFIRTQPVIDFSPPSIFIEVIDRSIGCLLVEMFSLASFLQNISNSRPGDLPIPHNCSMEEPQKESTLCQDENDTFQESMKVPQLSQELS